MEHNVDSADFGAVQMIMGVSNVVTSFLPNRFSRLFPLVPILLGLVWGVLKEAGSLEERLARAASGLLAISEYSLFRNALGTKPKDAPKNP